MKYGKKKDPIPIPIESEVGRGSSLVESSPSPDWSRYGPTIRFAELLEMTRVGRSKAYQLMNPKHRDFDPEFPTGFPLFNSPRSPKIWWTHLAAAWVEGRAKKSRKH